MDSHLDSNESCLAMNSLQYGRKKGLCIISTSMASSLAGFHLLPYDYCGTCTCGIGREWASSLERDWGCCFELWAHEPSGQPGSCPAAPSGPAAKGCRHLKERGRCTSPSQDSPNTPAAACHWSTVKQEVTMYKQLDISYESRLKASYLVNQSLYLGVVRQELSIWAVDTPKLLNHLTVALLPDTVQIVDSVSHLLSHEEQRFTAGGQFV